MGPSTAVELVLWNDRFRLVGTGGFPPGGGGPLWILPVKAVEVEEGGVPRSLLVASCIGSGRRKSSGSCVMGSTDQTGGQGCLLVTQNFLSPAREQAYLMYMYIYTRVHCGMRTQEKPRDHVCVNAKQHNMSNLQ